MSFLWILKEQTVNFHPCKKKKKKKKLNCDPQVNGVDNKMKKYKGYIESKNFIPYLGLSIDENLSWKTHIHSVANKISK